MASWKRILTTDDINDITPSNLSNSDLTQSESDRYYKLENDATSFLKFETNTGGAAGSLLYLSPFSCFLGGPSWGGMAGLYSSGSSVTAATTGVTATTGDQLSLTGGTTALLQCTGGESSFTTIRNTSGKILLDSNSLEIDAPSGVTADVNTFTINATDLYDSLKIVHNDSGSTANPDLVLYKNSPSPADNDALGSVRFKGNSSSNNLEESYASITARALDVTYNSKDAELLFQVREANVNQSGLTVQPRVTPKEGEEADDLTGIEVFGRTLRNLVTPTYIFFGSAVYITGANTTYTLGPVTHRSPSDPPGNFPVLRDGYVTGVMAAYYRPTGSDSLDVTSITATVERTRGGSTVEAIQAQTTSNAFGNVVFYQTKPIGDGAIDVQAGDILDVDFTTASTGSGSFNIGRVQVYIELTYFQ